MQSKTLQIKWQLENLKAFFLSTKGKCSCAVESIVETRALAAWRRGGPNGAFSSSGVEQAGCRWNGIPRRLSTSLWWLEHSTTPPNWIVSFSLFAMRSLVEVMHLVIVFDIYYVVYHMKNGLIYVRCWIRYLHDNVQLFVLYISMLCINWSHLENVVHGCDVSEESLELDEQIEHDGSSEHLEIEVLQVFHSAKMTKILMTREWV